MKRPTFVPESIKDEDVAKFVAAAHCAKREGKKEFMFAGKTYKVTVKGKTEDKLDPVNKAAAAKKFKNRKDKDIDNDGDVDDSDEYLHKRRKAIGKAMKKDECTSEKDFKPHMMYDPKTGKGFKANTYADHLKMDKMGYVHDKPKVKKESFDRVDAIVETVTGADKSDREQFIKEYNITEKSRYSDIHKSWKVFSK